MISKKERHVENMGSTIEETTGREAMTGKKFYSNNPIDLDRLINDIQNIGRTVKVVTADMENTFVIVLEQYFIRNNSSASCSVIINNMPNGALVVIIASGGGTGLLNISFGANQSLSDSVEKCLRNQCQLKCQSQLEMSIFS